MALTKISGSILKDPLNLGEVSIGGTLTYQDVTNVDSVGIITARSDISIADKIIHTGDTNTAIRFPAADTITGETGGSERLRINSSGLVNIGAGSSASGLSPLLHLHKNASNSSAYFHITNNDTGITNNDGFLLGINPSGDCLVFNKDSTPIRFATAGTERLRIDSSGDMGLGTGANIDRHFHVQGTDNIQGKFENNAAICMIEFQDSNTTAGNRPSYGAVGNNGVIHAGGSERVRINSSGYVGVKRSTPLANLHTTNNELAIGANPTGAAAPNATYDGLVVDGEDASILNIRSSADGNLSYGRVAFSDDVRSRGYIDYRHRDGAGGSLEYMNFAVAGSERLRIDTNGHIMTTGNVNIGRSSNAGEPLSVRGPVDGDAIRLERAGSYQWFIGQDSGSNLYFKANTNKEVTFPVAGGIAFNGETASNNSLNDYEQGNHNGADVSGAGLTLSYTNTGRYVKVGRQVYVTFDITYPSTSNTALSRISPPFNADIPYGGGWVGWNDLGRPMQVHQSGTSVYLMDCNSSGTAKHLYNNELSGKRIIGGYMFMTNS